MVDKLLKKYTSGSVLVLNAVLLIIAVKYINKSDIDKVALTDILVLVGLCNVFQFGIPVAFASTIAKHKIITTSLYKLSIYILGLSFLALIVIGYYLVGVDIKYMAIIPVILICNNFRGISEGKGEFWLSASLKLFSSSLLIWMIMLCYEVDTVWILFIILWTIALYLQLLQSRYVVKDVDTKFNYVPFLMQSFLTFSTVYLDRLIMKVISIDLAYVNFTLTHELLFRPIGLASIFAIYHFYQLNSCNRCTVRLGVKSYALHLIVIAVCISGAMLFNIDDMYFDFSGLKIKNSDIVIGLMWFLLILSLYLQRMVLALVEYKLGLYLLIIAFSVSSLVGVLITISYQSAVYSLLSRSMVESLILAIGLCRTIRNLLVEKK